MRLDEHHRARLLFRSRPPLHPADELAPFRARPAVRHRPHRHRRDARRRVARDPREDDDRRAAHRPCGRRAGARRGRLRRPRRLGRLDDRLVALRRTCAAGRARGGNGAREGADPRHVPCDAAPGPLLPRAGRALSLASAPGLVPVPGGGRAALVSLPRQPSREDDDGARRSRPGRAGTRCRTARSSRARSRRTGRRPTTGR